MVSQNHTQYLDVLNVLLGDKYDDDQLTQLCNETFTQIQHSITRLSSELVETGYSPDYARTTAMQIVPKPVLFSAVIEYRSGEWCGPIDHLDRARQIAYRDLQHDLLAPAFIAYLFDQTIDDYNQQVAEKTFIEEAVERAALLLPEQPDYYHNQMQALLSACQQGAISQTDLPDDLQPFWTAVPYIHRLGEAGIDQDEIADVLYTIADVLIHEHMGALGNAAAHRDQAALFGRPTDFFDRLAGQSQLDDASLLPHQITALCALRGQGYFMVSLSQYITARLTHHFDPEQGRYRGQIAAETDRITARTLLEAHPTLIALMRIYELIVKVGDDTGNVGLDYERKTLNWLLGDRDSLDTFLALSGLEQVDIDYDIRSAFVSLMVSAYHRAGECLSTCRSGHDLEKALHLHLSAVNEWLLPVEQQVTASIQAYVEQQSPPHRKALTRLLGIGREVVYGAIINAYYNDGFTEQMGRSLASADISCKRDVI